jgi:hypothetical protein
VVGAGPLADAGMAGQRGVQVGLAEFGQCLVGALHDRVDGVVRPAGQHLVRPGRRRTDRQQFGPRPVIGQSVERGQPVAHSLAFLLKSSRS